MKRIISKILTITMCRYIRSYRISHINDLKFFFDIPLKICIFAK